MSTPFPPGSGAARTMAALRAGRPGPAEVIDGAAHGRLDDHEEDPRAHASVIDHLEGRIARLEAAARQDEAQDQDEGGAA
jgi:hypothetical protein